MRIPTIKASNAVNEHGIAVSERAKVFVQRFREAFDFDGEENEIANKVWEVHQEIMADHDTYLEVGDALGPALRRALHTYVTMKWRER